MTLDRPTLRGRLVVVEPLEPRHVDGLLTVAEDLAPHAPWTYVPAARESMERYVAASLAQWQAGREAETKLLLLGFAFDVWGVRRITLKTDARNEQSRRAILAVGAQFEGIRRAHVPATDRTARDSAYYSILAQEWPACRTRLQERLARSR